MPTLDAWYWSIDADAVEAMIADDRATPKPSAVPTRPSRGRTRTTTCRPSTKLTEVVDGHRRIIDQLPLVGHVARRRRARPDAARCSTATGPASPDDRRHLLDRFQLVDAARKVVGVGSVGTRCWIALLEGGGDDDPLILQIKEAAGVGARAHLQPLRLRQPRPPRRRRPAAHAGRQRHVPRLDPRRASGVDYYWRQLRDMKGSADVNAQPTSTFLAYAELCGVTLARAHARSGDAAAISGYLGKGDASARRSGASPPPTPTRTSATTPHSCRRSRTAGCRPSRTCEATGHADKDHSRLSMPLGEAIFTQRSIRRFKPDPIPLDDLHLIARSRGQGTERRQPTDRAVPRRERSRDHPGVRRALPRGVVGEASRRGIPAPRRPPAALSTPRPGWPTR